MGLFFSLFSLEITFFSSFSILRKKWKSVHMFATGLREIPPAAILMQGAPGLRFDF